MALKAAAGFLLALAIWSWLAAPYTSLLAALSEGALRAFEHPAVTSIVPMGTLMVVNRADFPGSPSSVQLAVESKDITFNFILLVTLFAAAGRALSGRKDAARFAAAAACLTLVHVAAVVSFVKADYATRYGAWSASHYGVLSRNFWLGAPYFYSILGAHACAFALWWLFRPSTEGVTVAAAVRRNQRQQRAAARRAGRRERMRGHLTASS